MLNLQLENFGKELKKAGEDMVGESIKAYNPNAKVKLKLGERLKQSLTKVNKIFGYVMELDSEVFENYSKAFRRRISDAIVGGIEADSNKVKELINGFEFLEKDPDFTSLIMKYFLHTLNVHSDFENLEEEIEVTSFNDVREFRHLGYYLAKSCADIMGNEEGISFWKRIVALQHRDHKKKVESAMKSKEAPELTMKERGDKYVKSWIDYGLADFARLDIDDHKVLFRFDICLTPEAMKDLNDPEWAYLSSCYVTDAPEFNYGPQRLRRTQTLHTAPFCDEFYWDPTVYDEPEQPVLEFTEKLGKKEV